MYSILIRKRNALIIFFLKKERDFVEIKEYNFFQDDSFPNSTSYSAHGKI